MYALVHLDWKPTATSTTPPTGRAEAIYRGGTYTLVLRLWEDEAKTAPRTSPVGATYAAQIRTKRLGDIADPGDPLAEFVIDDSGAPAELVLSLAADVTLELDTKPDVTYFWDLDQDAGGIITPLFAGKVRVLDDVTRVGGS